MNLTYEQKEQMIQRINVGVDLDTFDQFRYLPKKFLASSGEYEIALHHLSPDQTIPRLYNSSFELNADSIDVYLHPAANAINAIVPLPHHYSMQLWEKPTQLSFLQTIPKEKYPELERFAVPEYVSVVVGAGRQQAKRQFSQMQLLGNSFVIRPNIGANGLGVKLISGDLIPKTIDELNSLDWITRVASNEAELEKYAANGFHFCELLPEATEIRVVRAMDGNMISAQRGRSITGQSNGLELGRVNSDYSVILRDTIDGLPISCESINRLIELIEPMQKCGSYDIWVAENGIWGIYEFSTQFALNCCKPELRIDVMKRYVESFVEDYLNK